MSWKLPALVAYSWVAGHFSLGAVQFMAANASTLRGLPRPVYAAIPFVAGAAWPVVLAIGLPGVLKHWRQQKVQAAERATPDLRVVE